jgi:hypothetical protein
MERRWTVQEATAWCSKSRRNLILEADRVTERSAIIPVGTLDISQARGCPIVRMDFPVIDLALQQELMR